MWWHEKLPARRRCFSLAVVFAIAGLTAGCFQPLYAEKTLDGQPGLKEMMSAVDVAQIPAPGGTPLSRIAVAVRNDLVFQTTGGDAPAPPKYRLKITLYSSQLSVIVDIQTNRPDVTNEALNATYELVDIKTGRVVMRDQTFARVSYDIPGEEQRFAAARALRDAENRAAALVASNIRNRLASYFAAGT
jgi:LPS-assembly lipoprotein